MIVCNTQGEKKMASRDFNSKVDAIAAGYRPVNRKTDRDSSGHPYYGYDFQDSDGNNSVTVWIVTPGDRVGKFIPMYPPTK